MQEAAHKIESWPIDKLIPYARDPRTHSDAQVAQIAGSIAEFGFNNAILVDSKAGVIAGHGRLLAARKLNLAEVPVIVLDHLSETQKRAFVIADNRLALNAGWDDELLQVELKALEEDEFNVALLGFEDDELARSSRRKMPLRGSRTKMPFPNWRRWRRAFQVIFGDWVSIACCAETARSRRM